MFSVFFMQGAAFYIKDHDYDSQLQAEFAEWYGSLYGTMFSLFAAVLGGADWLDILRPLVQISEVYKIAFAFYIFFVVVGVLNVLTVVFLDHAQDYQDHDIVVQDEISRMDSFVCEMLDFFREFDPKQTGHISYEAFATCIHDERVQAYLQSHMLDTTHADMLYLMLDTENAGAISIHDFIIGMLRLKGVAKELDAKVLLYEVQRLKHQVRTAAA